MVKRLIEGTMREVEDTLGGGECGPASLFLAWLSEEILNQQIETIEGDIQDKYAQEEYRNFVANLANALEIETNWLVVKNALLKLRKENPINIPMAYQERLAPVFRQLIVEEIKKDDSHRERMFPSLLAAYDHFVRTMNREVAQPLQDDTFVRHPKISQDQFKIFYAEYASEEDIRNWWRKEGHKQYIDEIAKDTAWIGDIDLFYGAKVLEIELSVMKVHFEKPQPIFYDRGEVPIAELVDETIENEEEKRLDVQEKIEELRIKGIVDTADARAIERRQLTLLPATDETIANLSTMDQTTIDAVRRHTKPAMPKATLYFASQHYSNVKPLSWQEEVQKVAAKAVEKEVPSEGEVFYLKPNATFSFDRNTLASTHFVTTIQKQIELDEKLARELASEDDVVKEQIESDEAMARRLQSKENAKRGPKTTRG